MRNIIKYMWDHHISGRQNPFPKSQVKENIGNSS